MKTTKSWCHMKLRFFHASLFATILVAGCSSNSSESWENMKTAGRYMQKSVDGLMGVDSESRMISSDEEFVGPYDGEFIPLNEDDLKNKMMAESALPQPKAIPGKNGIPHLDKFFNPDGDLANIFQTLHFETDDHILRNQSDIKKLMQLANYLKTNPKIFVMIAGHCDERASASYNMALGLRRANYIRSLLVKNGVDMNRVYTVSKGKEEPVSSGHTSDDWKLNRRAEFKIYK